jgi:hypothetical protein
MPDNDFDESNVKDQKLQFVGAKHNQKLLIKLKKYSNHEFFSLQLCCIYKMTSFSSKMFFLFFD